MIPTLTELREIINRMTSHLLITVKERTRFKKNPRIYESGFFSEYCGKVSFLEHALTEKEDYYEKIGRYRADYEFRLTDNPAANERFRGENVKEPCIDVSIDTSFILPMYAQIIDRFCAEGSDEKHLGQIVDRDVEAVLGLVRRTNIGRYVAEIKYQSNPELQTMLKENPTDRDQRILELLIDKKRERDVITDAKEFAVRIGLDAEKTGDLFREIIDKTTQLELHYLLHNYGKKLNTGEHR